MAMLTAVYAVAALTQALGAGHWVAAFGALGGEPWARYLTAVLELAGLGLFWWPGRRGYGAAVLLAVALGALAAHVAVLGISSAPPALVMALGAGLVLRQSRGDFRR
jgi:hypothetical protein